MTDPSSTLPEWDLATIYPSVTSSEYRRDLDVLERLAVDLETVVARLGNAQPGLGLPDRDLVMFEQGMARLNEATLAAWRLDSFVVALLDTDANHAAAQSAEARIQQILAQLTAQRRQLIAWTQRVGIDTLTDRSAYASDLSYPLQRMTERATRLMPEGEEALAAELRRHGAAAWSQLRRSMTAAMQVRWDNGEVEQSIPLGDLRALTRATNRDVRRAAYELECAAWSAHALPLAASLNAIKGEAAILAVRRGWSSPLDEALWQFGLDRAALDALLTATYDALPHFHRFLRAKARRIGSPRLAWYDMTAPVGTGEVWSFEEAEALVVEAFHAFSSSMGSLADRAFRERWIDARPRPGKQSGGLCYWLGDGVSRIRLEFYPGYEGVRTIAHELGHAYHAAVLASAGRTALEIETTPLPVWETASKFCEQLVHHHAVRRGVNTGEDQLTVLDGRLTAMYRSIVEALTVFLFEVRFFAQQGTGGLGVEEINELMTAAWAETSGDALDPTTPFPWTWAALPNLYLVDTPFYNLPYLIAQLIGVGLYAQYENDPSGVRHAFDEALSMTGAGSLSAFVGHVGMDSSSTEFWSAGLGVIARDIDRYDALVGRPGEGVADPAHPGGHHDAPV